MNTATRFVETARIGDGIHGSVARAVDLASGCDVALKTVPIAAYLPHADSDEGRTNAGKAPPLPLYLIRELEALRSLNHPNILRLHSVHATPPTSLTLVLDHCPSDLALLISAHPGLSEGLAKSIVRGLLRGLEHMHKRAIVHRDIKPANILLGPDGAVQIGDFGLSRVYERRKDVDSEKISETIRETQRNQIQVKLDSDNHELLSQNATLRVMEHCSSPKAKLLTSPTGSTPTQPAKTFRESKSPRRLLTALLPSGTSFTNARIVTPAKRAAPHPPIEPPPPSRNITSPTRRRYRRTYHPTWTATDALDLPNVSPLASRPALIMEPTERDRRSGRMTPQVATRWYRPPSLLLSSQIYTPSCDLWSAGCVMAELLLGRPLFPGASDIDQLARIVGCLGWPREGEEGWAELSSCPDYDKIAFAYSTRPTDPMESILPQASAEARNLLNKLLQYSGGLEASEALLHPWFASEPLPVSDAEVPIVERSSIGRVSRSSSCWDEDDDV
ncbi:Cyclin-dependent kinase 20 [Gonapodya sp. JEL0774]|nr:Cyclin-dependent kinase 20 [Gonapodya sp. JEL0774]